MNHTGQCLTYKNFEEQVEHPKDCDCECHSKKTLQTKGSVTHD